MILLRTGEFWDGIKMARERTAVVVFWHSGFGSSMSAK
jgi:hypothetical protein